MHFSQKNAGRRDCLYPCYDQGRALGRLLEAPVAPLTGNKQRLQSPCAHHRHATVAGRHFQTLSLLGSMSWFVHKLGKNWLWLPGVHQGKWSLREQLPLGSTGPRDPPPRRLQDGPFPRDGEGMWVLDVCYSMASPYCNPVTNGDFHSPLKADRNRNWPRIPT